MRLGAKVYLSAAILVLGSAQVVGQQSRTTTEPGSGLVQRASVSCPRSFRPDATPGGAPYFGTTPKAQARSIRDYDQLAHARGRLELVRGPHRKQRLPLVAFVAAYRHRPDQGKDRLVR